MESQTAPGFQSTTEMAAQGEIEIPAPTRSTFMASWPSVNGALGYMLDVSTNDSFSSYVDGYHDLDVGNVTARVVTGLNRGTTYYYRVRAYGGTGSVGHSAVMSVTTETTAGLIINPTFDSSITGNPNAAAIEAMINRAISFHESLFSDPITIQIRFRYSTTGPDGIPLPAHTGAQSVFVIYQIPWSIYIGALRADARTSNDSVANASSPSDSVIAKHQTTKCGGTGSGIGHATGDAFRRHHRPRRTIRWDRYTKFLDALSVHPASQRQQLGCPALDRARSGRGHWSWFPTWP